jgi:hypothetical protein
MTRGACCTERVFALPTSRFVRVRNSPIPLPARSGQVEQCCSPILRPLLAESDLSTGWVLNGCFPK